MRCRRIAVWKALATSRRHRPGTTAPEQKTRSSTASVAGVLSSSKYQAIISTAPTKLDPAQAPLSTSLGVLGIPGLMAYVGLKTIGQPKAGETVVVSAASGAVGAVAGQLAKRDGCHIVGIVGGTDKCRYVTEELSFDACVDHRCADLDTALETACSK